MQCINVVDMKLEDAIKQKKFDDKIEKAIVNVIFTYNWLRDEHTLILKPYGLLLQHFNILRILRGRYPDIMCPGEIKEVMLDKGNDVTRLIDKLVSMGLAERKLCESNRRKMDVCITHKGLDLVKELSAKIENFSSRIKNEFAENEAELLSSLLDKMRG